MSEVNVIDVKKSEEAFSIYISRPWVKFYDEGVPPEVEIKYFPLYEALDRVVRERPNDTAFIYFGRRISYREFGEASDRFAAALRNLGVRKGDVVALLLPNTPQFAIAYYGAAKLGAVVTTMNPLYAVREIAYQSRDSEAKVIVTLDMLYPRVAEAAKEYRFDYIVVTGLEEYMPGYMRPLYRLKMRGQIPKVPYGGNILKLQDLLKTPPTSYREPIDPHNDLLALMYTGGTTGLPKGAEITHANVVANVQQIDPIIKAVKSKLGIARDVLVGALPWFHIYGQVVVLHYGVYAGATTLVYPRFEVERVMSDIQKYKATLFHGVPTMYVMLLNHPKFREFNVRSLVACISGAAPLPGEVAKRFEEATGARLREGYGLTETAVVTHVNPVLGKYKIGSIGLPIPNTLAAIADLEKPLLLPPREIGEIVISGPQVMRQYHNRPEENKLAFFEYKGIRWFRTGDIGYMDEEGYFYVVDRKKDMIKYKGYSVFPREIEEVLYAHECVREAAVIGIPDPEAGEIPKAYIVLRDECKGRVTEEDFKSYLRERVAAYAVPKAIEFRAELPKSAVGKILKRELREEELRKLGK